VTSDPFRLVGTVLAGKYQVDRMIGEGGFGVVYAGTHLHLGTPVAIKCLKGATSAMVHSLVREARLLFNLTHPGIVRMYDAGDANGVPYVVLELVEGFSLDQEVDRRRLGQAAPMSAAEIGDIIGSMLDALAYAHAKGVVHGDLKPSNVMVLRDRTASITKILDFGTALVRSGSNVTGGVGLTPKYAAPEQWDATIGKVTPSTDLFAVGLVLEELASGHNLVQGDSVQQLISSVMAPKQSMIRSRRPDLAPALADVVLRATQIRPQDRFANATEFAQALRVTLAGGRPSLPIPTPQPATPYTPSSPLAYTSGSPPPITSSPPVVQPPIPMAPVRPPGKSSSSGIGCVLAVLLLLFLGGAGAAGFWVFSMWGARPAPSVTVIPTATITGNAPPSVPVTAVVPSVSTTATSPIPTQHPTIAQGTSTSTSTSAGTSTGAGTSASAKKLYFNIGVSTHAGLYPDQGKFTTMVEKTHGPGLQVCFDNEHQADMWSAIVVVRFQRTGKPTVTSSILHEGNPESGPIAKNIASCIGNAADWPWPQPQGWGELDGGNPFIRFSTGYSTLAP
jgi:serine/threonine-protein kinase